ncbi:hypothetical protein [Sorangium sp. So ce1024]
MDDQGAIGQRARSLVRGDRDHDDIRVVRSIYFQRRHMSVVPRVGAAS